MTTIITKNGSGAPTAGQLTTGELAVDLTNKELYTKDSGGNVIKVGAQGGSTGTFTDLTATSSFTSPGIDDNATTTAITIDANENVTVGGTTAGNAGTINVSVGSPGSTVGGLQLWAGTSGSHFMQFGDSASGDGYYRGAVGYLHTSDALVAYSAGTERMRIDASGDVMVGDTSSYLSAANRRVLQATGSTDGSILSLQGTSGDFYIHSGGGDTANVNVVNRANGYMNFFTNNTERMRIAADGNVGIGTASTNAVRLTSLTSTANHIAALFENSNTADSFGLVVKGGNDANDYAADFRKRDNTTIMRIRGDGNVGIGTDNPGSLLHLSAPSHTIALDPNYLRIANQTSGRLLAIGVEDNQDAYFWNANNNSTGALKFLNGPGSGTERMRIDASGNLLVGQTTAYSGAGTTITQDGDISNASNSGVASSINLGGIVGVSNGFQITTNTSNQHTYTFLNGASVAAKIDLSGNLLVGTTNVSFGTGDASCRLLANGRGLFEATSDSVLAVNRQDGTGYANIVQFYRGNNLAGTIQAQSAAAPRFAANSDRRLKENIIDHESELANVMALRPVRWDWKEESLGQGEGFIAQEVQETSWSDLVIEGDDGMLQLASLGAVETRLIKAMQEQQAMIETLQAEVAALKGA